MLTKEELAQQVMHIIEMNQVAEEPIQQTQLSEEQIEIEARQSVQKQMHSLGIIKLDAASPLRKRLEDALMKRHLRYLRSKWG